MLKKLEEMYSKINHEMDVTNVLGNDIGLLYFGKKKDSPDIIILNKNNCINKSDINDTVNLLYRIGEEVNCNKFHLVTSVKPDNTVLKDLAFLNIKVSDYNDIEDMNKSISDGSYIELLPHNEYTLREAVSLLNEHKKVAMIQATGTGKSFLIGRFLSNTAYGTKIVITPSRHIINQIQRYFEGIIGDDINFITYSKLISMSDEELTDLKVDTIILDEFHRAGAEKWEESVRRLIDLHKDAYLIGTTATPRRYLDKDRNMVDELFDGISTEEIDVSSAIARGILPNPKYVYSVFDFESEIDKALDLVEKVKYKEEEESLKEDWIVALNNFKLDWNNSKGLEDVIENYLNKDGKNKFIVFCSSRTHIEEMKVEFRKCFNKSGFILENEESVYNGLYNNEKTLSRFEDYKIKESNGVSLLYCIDMLSEGVHLKPNGAGTDLRGVFLMRSTESPIIFYQQIGRALSSTMGETPIVFDLTNNCANIKTKFYQYDLEENEESINRIRKNFGMKQKKFTSTIDVRCIDILTLLSTIKSRFDVPWEDRIAEVEEFVKINGHGAISKSNANEDLVLWAQKTRSRYFGNDLAIEYIEALNALGFVWDLYEYKWQERLKGLQEFKGEDGFITSIKKDVNADYHNYAARLRTNYRKGILPKEKIEDLEKIGFVWEVEEHKWNIMYKELSEYNKQKREAELNFKSAKPQSKELRVWLTVQKAKYDKGKLSEKQLKLLKEANVSFLREEDSWTKGYNKYLLAMSKSKDSVPSYASNWVYKQRKLYEQGKLTEEQIEILRKEGISLRISDTTFWSHFEKLVEYKLNYGSCRVLEKNAPSKTFYAWYNNLKTVFDKLSKDKQDALLSLGYVRYTRDAIWNENMEIYRRIKDKPYSELTKEEIKVHRWACAVKRRYKDGTLNKSKIEEAKEVVFA